MCQCDTNKKGLCLKNINLNNDITILKKYKRILYHLTISRTYYIIILLFKLFNKSNEFSLINY